MTTPEEWQLKLQKYNWSSDKDYQLAVIAIKELLEDYKSPQEVSALLSKAMMDTKSFLKEDNL